MPVIHPHRPRKGPKRSQSDQWSEWSTWSWNEWNDEGRWQRYRMNLGTQDYEYEYRDEDPEGTASAAPYVSQQYDQTPPLPDDGGHFSKPYNDYAEQPPNNFLPDATTYQAPSTSNPVDPNPSPWPLTHSHSDPGTTTQPNPELNIEVYDVSGVLHHHVALMDTGAGSGLWIAQRIVKRLGLPVDFGAPEQMARVANDQLITSEGQVVLHWKVTRGLTMQKNTFTIFNSEHFDIILGMEFLSAMGIVPYFNITPLMPLAPATTESAHHQAQREKAQREQQLGATQSRERKKKSESRGTDRKSKDSSSSSFSSEQKKSK